MSHRLYDIRESVEGYLAFLAAQNFREECEKARGIILSRWKNQRKCDHDGFDDENRKFHALIIEAAGNPFMVDIINQVDDKLHRLARMACTSKAAWKRLLKKTRISPKP